MVQIIDNEELPVLMFQENASRVGAGGVQIQIQIKSNQSLLVCSPSLIIQRVLANASKEHELICIAVGIEYGNSTIGNTLMNIIWLPEHNRITRRLWQH